MRWVLIALAVGMASLGSGCLESADTDGEALIIRQIPRPDVHEPDLDAYFVGSAKPSRLRGANQMSWLGDINPDNPCDCQTFGCIDNWAETNLGCDICVTLVCDGSPVSHACHHCGDGGGGGGGDSGHNHIQ